MEDASRLNGYQSVASYLSLLSDRQVDEVVAGGALPGAGIGGRWGRVQVRGTAVFVKRVPLTDLELLSENVRSTANLFDLPMYYQYGIGSAGFGAWRELESHIITTAWVLENQFAGFPLLYHWRVLPESIPPDVGAEFGGIDGAVAHWEGSAAVRGRLQAIASSTHSLVLFMEYVPQALATWLARNPAPQLWVERGLAEVADFMSAQGMVHFDAHFHNVLTDGRSLFLADLVSRV